MEADSSYFVRDCHSLTEPEKLSVKTEFARVLNSYGVCRKRSTQVCSISDMSIICGRSGRRQKRGAGRTNETTVDLKFNLTAIKIQDQPKDCGEICVFLKIPQEHCEKLCVVTYRRFLRASVLHARSQLSRMFGSDDARGRAVFSVGRRRFEPDGVVTSAVRVSCAPGMVEHGDACGESASALWCCANSSLLRHISRKSKYCQIIS